MPAVVVFDLDGTLSDSQEGIMASYKFTLDQLGMDADDETIRGLIGPPLSAGFTALGVPPAGIEAAITLYRRQYSASGVLQNSLYPGVEDMLAALRDAGFLLAVATAKMEAFAEQIVTRSGIADYFQVVAGASQDQSRIHKDQILDYALGLLQLPQNSTVTMVGDRAQDMSAAVSCGAVPVGVTWGYGSASELRDAGATSLVNEPGELLDVLRPPGP